MSTPAQTLCRRDYLILAAFCLLLFGFPLVFNRTFSTHETIHCVNVREMIADGDWVIPHFGGRPWLERPPLPFWITIPLIRLFGDAPAVFRLAPLLAGSLAVLLVGWMTSVWYGRTLGLLAGLTYATVREVTHYAVAPECDVFLCAVITTAVALFVALEFQLRPSGDQANPGEGGFFGKRPWLLVVFFTVLGLTNLVKGLFFGTVLTLIPVASYLLLGPRPWSLVRRYLWLPGWLAFAVAGSAWAFSAYQIYPDIVELWKSDYMGRLKEGYMGEPWWYYLVNLPWALFPWSIAAVVGVVTAWPRIVSQGRTPERFLFVWGAATIAVLSIPQGKHHHYLLHSIAPWAIFAALGTVRIWNGLLTIRPGWTGSPTLVRNAAVALFSFLLVAHSFGHAFHTLFDDRYASDRVFARSVGAQVPDGQPLLILDDYGPLDPSWMIFYLDRRCLLLHNVSFLRRQKPGDEVYLVGRRARAAELAPYGVSEVLLESERSRDGAEPEKRFCLFRLRLNPGLDHHPAPVYISPMQATGRAAPGSDA